MKIDTAVVLAGGPGLRLRPLTEDTPKGMIQICEKPLLQWIMEWLRDNGIKRVILGVAYLKEKIIDYFGSGAKLGVRIEYSAHSVPGGTGEGFRLAIERHVSRDVFFAMNGDQITDLNLYDVAKFHLKHEPIATMVVTNPRCPYGHVQINSEYNATAFTEKLSCPYALCNTGIYVFDRKILRYLPKSGDIEKTAFPALAKEHQLKVYPFKGFFATINSYKDLFLAERQLRRAK